MLTGEQIQAARVLVRLRQPQLAEAAGVSIETIKRLEGMRGTVAATVATVMAIKRSLEAAGVIFIDENGEGPGVRLRKVPG
jgi:transcriptional regulator with XRE-family HTH domain